MRILRSHAALAAVERHLGLLQSAVARPQATFDKQDLYPDLFLKAAALLESLIGNHAFLDGNKRTAITSAGLFLHLNDYCLKANNQQLETFTLDCALHLFSLDQMALWHENQSEVMSRSSNKKNKYCFACEIST